MSRKPNSSAVPETPAFVKGQIWSFDTRCIRIEHVGKLLVEHRGVALDDKTARSPKRMMAIKELHQFLAANHAVLVIN